MGCRRRHAHRRPFLKVAEAETTADIGALAERLMKAVHEAEVLGLPDVRRYVEAALDCVLGHGAEEVPIAGQAPEVRSVGQHEPETAP